MTLTRQCPRDSGAAGQSGFEWRAGSPYRSNGAASNAMTASSSSRKRLRSMSEIRPAVCASSAVMDSSSVRGSVSASRAFVSCSWSYAVSTFLYSRHTSWTAPEIEHPPRCSALLSRTRKRVLWWSALGGRLHLAAQRNHLARFRKRPSWPDWRRHKCWQCNLGTLSKFGKRATRWHQPTGEERARQQRNRAATRCVGAVHI